MELFSALSSGLFGTVVTYILPFLFVLTMVVFVHELGHFLVGRWCGVEVKTFSIGFGPELFGFDDRHGTRWRFALIPLGGYVKFFGDSGAASTPDHDAAAAMTPEEQDRSFFYKPVWKRAAIVAAGPIANFLFAVAIFAGSNLIFGRQVLIPRVDQVQAGSVAEKAGFKSGDVILSIDGRPIESFSDMQRVVSTSAGRQLLIVVDRNDRQVDIEATPELRVINTPFGKQRLGILGIQASRDPSDITTKRYGPLRSLRLAFDDIWFVIDRTFAYVGGLIAGRESADQLSGPIRIAQVSGEVAHAGLLALFNLAAVLSVSIGLINLVPIPLLDGGHLLYYGVEAVRGRPLSERAQELGFRIGLAIVVLLMLFTTVNDVLHLAAS
jgi:regulator of sigma E protease